MMPCCMLDVIENLQGAPLPASLLETEILPARVAGYKPADLDMLIGAGEVVWVGSDECEKSSRSAREITTQFGLARAHESLHLFPTSLLVLLA